MKSIREIIDKGISKDTQVFLVFLLILVLMATSLVLTYFAIFVVKWGK